MVRVTSVPDVVLAGAAMVTVPLEVPPAFRYKLVGYVISKRRLLVARTVKFPPSSWLFTEKGTEYGVPGVATASELAFRGQTLLRQRRCCRPTETVVARLSVLTVMVRLEELKLVDVTLWKFANALDLTPSRCPFTRTRNSADGGASNSTKKLPLSCGFTTPSTSSDPSN